MGRSMQAGPQQSHPLRLFCRFKCDRMSVLIHTHKIKDSVYSTLRINRWLTWEDIANIKTLRVQCKELKSKAPKRADGKTTYIVISGKVMIASNSGQLSLHKNQPNTPKDALIVLKENSS